MPADLGYDTLTIIVSTAGLLWLFVRQTNRQFDAQRAETARQFEALRVEHREGLAQVGERVAELRADFRAVLPRAAAEPAGRPQAPVVAAPQRRED